MKKYISDKILSKEEVEKLPKLPKIWYKTICENCGKVFERTTKNSDKGQICKICKCSLTQKEMYKNNPNLGKERLEKRTKSNLEKYGVENSYQRNDVKQKIKQTTAEKYGVDNYSKTKECQEKIKKTCLEKYGVEYSFQSKNNKSKSKETLLRKYGVNHIMNYEPIKNIVIQKLKKKRKQIIIKFRQTCLEKYGVDHPMKNHKIQLKSKKKYKYNNIYFDSSWEIAFYIYHIKNGFNIKRATKSFEYEYNGKIHFYFPDFEIDGKFYEIKGLQFFKNKDYNDKMICPFDRSLDGLYEAKHQCMIKNNVQIITDCSKYLKYVKDKYKEFFNLVSGS